MSKSSHHRHVATLLASLPALACLLPAPAQANDRDLRGTPVPASGCIEVASSNLASRPFANGALMLSSSPSGPQILSLRCPLPVNNIELSGITNDNDITKIRVHYLDNDGLGNRAGIGVQLVRTEVSSSEPLDFSAVVVCQWGSNVDGDGVTVGTTDTFPCPHDVASNAFYYVGVDMEVATSDPADQHKVTFLGADFPP